MDELRFDTLLGMAAQQSTRRAAFSALLSGAVLLDDRGEIEATKKAERRKKRRRHERANGTLIRDVSILVDNRASTKPIIVNFGASSLVS